MDPLPRIQQMVAGVGARFRLAVRAVLTASAEVSGPTGRCLALGGTRPHYREQGGAKDISHAGQGDPL